MYTMVRHWIFTKVLCSIHYAYNLSDQMLSKFEESKAIHISKINAIKTINNLSHI